MNKNVRNVSFFKKTLLLIIIIITFISGVLIGWKRGIPFLVTSAEYSIGIFDGISPFNLNPASIITNPVLTANDVKDIPAAFVADPFMVYEKGIWYMFFEVLNKSNNQGDIGLAHSKDGYHWSYEQIVLNEPYHLSYPYVFKWKNDFFMIPESHEIYEVRLYRALDFPKKWIYAKTLLKGNFVDSSIFRYNGKWWMFTSDRWDILHLFWADDLYGPWNAHLKNPIILNDSDIARPAGRVLQYKNKIFRFGQDCNPTYGNQVRAFEITELNPEHYREKGIQKNPILKPSGSGWNAKRMHHIDVHEISDNRWVACVDGVERYLKFSFKY